MMKQLYRLLFLLTVSSTAAFSQNISYSSLYDNATFNGRAINTSLAVGSTPGAGSVSANGSASYSIPIATPPGTNNVVPGVSIDYNSAGNGGNVGTGWNISGLSAIVRVARNVYFDGTAGAVDLSANDRFALDGVRLIGKTGTYGAAGSTYGTEVENFATVTAIGSSGTGPLSFEVVGKDGVKMEFGNTTDSRLMAQTGGTVLFWRLNKVIYPDGNYIEYVYTDTSTERDSRISEIRYTGNQAAGLAPYNKIEFAWKVRQESAPGTFSDIRVTYEAGSSIVSKYLLDQVTVKAEGAIARKYQFAYGHDNVNSYLKSVTEYGSDNSQLNATIFKYGDTPAEVTNVNTTVASSINIQAMSGDFDGDGKHEILSAHVSTTSLEIPYYDNFKIFKANASGTDYTQVAYQPLPTNYTVVNKIDIPNSRSFIPSDFTGDGIDDVMTLKVSYTGSYNKLDSVTIYESTNGGTAFVPHRRSIQPNYFRLPGNNRFFFIGDFDGDGISEYLTILGEASGTIYQPFLCGNYLTSGACGLVSIPGGAGFATNTWVDASDIQTLDFNGDGKTDLLLVKNNACEIFTFNGTEATRIYAGAFPLSNKLLYIGDFNGDGKTDLIQAEPDFSQLTKALSTGTGFDQSPLTLAQPWPTNQPVVEQSNKIIVGDYNGDGKSDLYYKWMRMMHYPNSTGYDIHTFTGTEIYYSQGTSFLHKALSYNEDIQVGLGRPSTVTYIDDAPFDLNGDGRTDLVSSGGTILSYKLFNKEGKDNLLHKVSNGLNHVTEWNYKSLVEGGSFYSRGTGTSTYPLNIIQPAAILVSGIKVPNGIGGTSEINYGYEQARLHRAGKGFLGFGKVITTDLVLGMRTVSENQFNTTYYVLIPWKSTTYLNSSNAVLNTTTQTNVIVSPASKRFWIKTTGLLEENSLTTRSVSTSNTYDDSNGNITFSRMDINSGVEATETTTVYGAYPGSIPNKPTSVTVAKTRGSQTPAFSVTTTFGYNSIGQLTSKTDFAGTAKSVTTTYGYNTTGNVNATTVSPSGMTARASSVVYDSKGRFGLTSTNALNQSSSATYDAKWGKALTLTTIEGLTTTYSYDGFGRLITAGFPGPYTMTQSYLWDQANGAVWKTIQAYSLPAPDPAQGKPDVTTWYDLLGRQIRTETEGLGGTIIQTQTFDARGNLKTTSEPYKSGESYISTTNTYHSDYNWLTSVDRGALGITNLNYSYAGGNLTLTTQTPGGTTTKVTDAAGKVVSATDAGGTLTYTYYNHGGSNQIKKDNVVISTSEYDSYGRQNKLTDANAGVTVYDYNALGELVSQTNANGHTHTMVYDVLGQITSRSGPEGTTSYVYGTSNSGGEIKNRIKQVTGFTGGNQTSYVYDALGRTSSVTEKIDNVDHTTTYTYNNYGAVVRTTYPSGLQITNVYDQNGYLTSISNGSSTLYSTSGVNGRGQVTGYSLGNGKSSANTFVNGFPTQLQTSGIQSLNMVWDYQKGNLTSRNDARGSVNKTESFTYDNLNRLTGSQISGVTGTFTVSYATNGNISSKTDAGSYLYDATKTNAVAYVSNPTPSPISSLQQDITYTAFNQPGIVSENGNQLTYTYGADYERIKGVLLSGSSTVYTRFYFAGGFEKDITASGTRYIQYITSPAGLIAIVVSNGSSHDIHYTYTDHLGSIVTVTDGAGNPEAQQSFDAWGRRRDYQSWSLLAPTATVPGLPDWLYRGYTGHEHLDRFGLINMNGRLYDPVLGRVLSPDNYVQDPYGTQDYNRYTYARNNPLLYNDPDGNNPILGALIGAVSYTLGVAFSDGGFRNWSWFGFASSVVVGAMTAGFASDLGSAVSTLPLLTRSAIQAGAYAGFGGTTSYLTGGSFATGALTSFAGSVTGSLTGGLNPILQLGASAAFGGIVAELNGGNFWSGAGQALIIAAFNHLAHKAFQDDPIEKLRRKILKDNRLTLEEANEWYRKGNGGTLVIDARELDFGWVTDDGWNERGEKQVQSLFLSRDGRVHGNVNLIRINANEARIQSDWYDFEQYGKWYEQPVRNPATALGKWVADDYGRQIGRKFTIEYRGTTRINLPRIISKNYFPYH